MRANYTPRRVAVCPCYRWWVINEICKPLQVVKNVLSFPKADILSCAPVIVPYIPRIGIDPARQEIDVFLMVFSKRSAWAERFGVSDPYFLRRWRQRQDHPAPIW